MHGSAFIPLVGSYLDKPADLKAVSDVKVVTPAGDVVRIPTDAIKHLQNVDASGELVRFFLNPEAEIEVTIKGDMITASRAGTNTIYKYLDDGGTISKSRDDLAADPV
ncbi:hypothetical protein [Azospirillum sp. TSO5]|uniref:hypothetical protein n=1 Tax=Azospirillum sp. TSO5 TaxID=716760 RepID=UPI0011B26412|nr:hypothetical protein [Azospirillum sp. TSO5]